MSKPRPISSLLANKGLGVKRLLDHVKRLEELENRVRSYLPVSVAPHCRVANLRNETLVLVTESSAWHNKLRYVLPQIASKLNAEAGFQVRDIELRVSPLHHTDKPVDRLSLSDSAANILRSTAEATEDPELRRALHRLAGRKKN